MKRSVKTFQKDGKWVEKTTLTFVQTCACGFRYIKTRDGQTVCIKCFTKHSEVK